MATYLELHGLFHDGDLNNKIVTATIIAANDLLSVSPTAADNAFADLVFSDPLTMARKVLMSVLAANVGVSVASIQSAADASLQANVDTVIPNLVDALAGV